MSGFSLRTAIVVVLYSTVWGPTTKVGGGGHELELELGKDGESYREMDVPASTNLVRLGCSHGNQWVVPSSVPQTKDVTVSAETRESGGSSLVIRLPPGPPERGHWRGLYQCCSTDKDEGPSDSNVTVTWVRRSDQPSCCPCCPWYEQEHCLTKWDNAVETIEPRCSLSVFLYTHAIPEEAVQLHIVPGQPMLVPCPALLHSSNWWPEIQLQIVPKYPFGWSWFPFQTPETQRISYAYDSRYGLCLNKSQFQRSIPYLICQYPKVNRTRTIRLIWPPPPPTVAPEVRMQFVSPGASEKGDPLNLTNFEENAGAISQEPPIYRVQRGSHFRVYCIASYNQTGIVRRPPPRLCFNWERRDLDSKLHTISNNYSDDRTSSHCVSVKTTMAARAARVYAFSAFELPPVQVNVSLRCEVLTPARQAPPAHKMAYFIVRPRSDDVETAERLRWFVKEPAYLLHSDGYSSLTVMDVTKSAELRLYFWHIHEVGQSPVCSLNVSSGQDVRVNHTLAVTRESDRWQCRITFHQINSSLSGQITFGYGEEHEKLSLYVINSSTWQRPRVIGLHSHVLHPFNLMCKHNPNAAPTLPKWAESEAKPSIIWWVEFNETVTKVKSEDGNRLELPPLYNETSIHVFTYKHETADRIDQIPTKNHQVPAKQPSLLCVTCEVSYAFGTALQSERDCKHLVDFDQTDVDISNMTPETPPLLLLFRQPSSRTISSSETSMVAAVADQPMEIQCLFLEGVLDPLGPSLPTSLWPVIEFPTNSYFLNSSGGETIHTVFEISPYWRGLRIQLPQLKTMESSEDIACTFESSKVTVQLHVMSPARPQIVHLQNESHADASNHTVKLACYARGFPAPTVWWQTRDQTDGDEGWTSVKHCEASQDALNYTICVHNFNLNTSEELSVAQCVALNAFGRATSVQTIHSAAAHVKSSSGWIGIGQPYIWIGTVVLLVILLMGLSTLSFCMCHWTKQTLKICHLNRKRNILYAKCKPYSYFSEPDTGSLSYQWIREHTKVMRVIAKLLGSMEEAYKWTVPVECLQTSTVRLGLGHYGQVSKGWLSPHCSRSHRSGKESEITGTETPVAIKAASGETGSLSCLRNEIALLPSLSSGPNIIRMMGLTLGVNEDLSDTLLLLEYCSHKSLSEFIRKRAHHITNGNQRVHKWSIKSCDSGVCSLPDHEGGLIESANSSRNGKCGPPHTDTVATEEGGLHRKHGRIVDQSEFHLTVCDLYRIAYEIACGLTYLAESGIIHRDLATRNILVDQFFNPKICDFGLAVRVSTAEQSTGGTAQSNEGYQILTRQKQLPFRILPPEALREQIFYLASDIWEYGLLLWQLFSLETKRPFSTVSTVDELVKLLFSVSQTAPVPAAPPSIDRPRLVHEQLWLFMCQAWNLDHKLRPRAQEFKELLWDLLNAIHRPEENQTTQDASCNLPVLYTEIIQPESDSSHPP